MDGARDGSGLGRKISRRTLFRYGATAGALTAAPGTLTPRSRAASAAAAEAESGTGFEFSEMTISKLQSLMAAGEVTSAVLTRAYVDRIERIDWHGPRLNSVIEVNPDALLIARARDDERRSGNVRGPLHGIPVLLKDNIATEDGMETTAGSFALLGSVVPRDAFIARQLRNAGAVLLGKANMSEWAGFRGYKAISGWSGRAGVGPTPYALNRMACGSSSGSAAATAASLTATAIGTETDGSIVCPSGSNSCVGLKPTLGLTSRSGVIPIAHSQDVVGPISRTVEDAAITLGGIVGVDRRDAATQASEGRPRDYRRFLDRKALRGARLGVWRENIFGFSPETDAVGEAALAALQDLGAVLVDPADIPDVFDAQLAAGTVLLYEFKADLNAYLEGLASSNVRSLAEVIAFNAAHADVELPWFGQEIMERAERFGPLTEPAYLDALETSKRMMRRAIRQTMAADNLDAIVSVTNEYPWTLDLTTGDHFVVPLAPSTAPAIGGFPHVTVPAGYAFDDDLPIGLSFIARAWEEPKLLGFAYAFEQATKARHAPRFRPQVASKDFVPRDIELRRAAKAGSRPARRSGSGATSVSPGTPHRIGL